MTKKKSITFREEPVTDTRKIPLEEGHSPQSKIPPRKPQQYTFDIEKRFVWSLLTNSKNNRDIIDACSGESAAIVSLLREFGFLFLILGYDRNCSLEDGLLRLQEEHGSDSPPPECPYVLFCLHRIFGYFSFQQRFLAADLPQRTVATFGTSATNISSSYPSSSTRNVRNQLRDELKRIFRNMASLIHRSNHTNSSALDAVRIQSDESPVDESPVDRSQVDRSQVDDERDSETIVREAAAASTQTRSSRRRSSRRIRKPPKRYGEWATKR